MKEQMTLEERLTILRAEIDYLKSRMIEVQTINESQEFSQLLLHKQAELEDLLEEMNQEA